MVVAAGLNLDDPSSRTSTSASVSIAAGLVPFVASVTVRIGHRWIIFRYLPTRPADPVTSRSELNRCTASAIIAVAKITS